MSISTRIFQGLLSACVVLLVVTLSGCGISQHVVYHDAKLPQLAVRYLERVGLQDEMASFSYGEDVQWEHPVYAMGLNMPDCCWTVEMKDGATLCFFPKGEWVYTVASFDENAMSSLDVKYLAEVSNLETVLVTMKNMVGEDVRIVGVAKEGEIWVISAYKKRGISYRGAPTRYYFDDGVFLGSAISI